MERITAEMLKKVGLLVFKKIHTLMEKDMGKRRGTRGLKNSELTVSYMKGDTKDCKIYWGMALLSVTG